MQEQTSLKVNRATTLANTVTHAASQSVALKFYLLGPLRIERAGERLHLPRRKVELLIAYLLLHPGRQSREQLATLFWGDASDAQARHSLRTALATVRGTLAPDLFLADRDYVQLNPDFACWVDLHELLALGTHTGGNNTGGNNIGSNNSPLAAKLALWQGDLLEGYYDEWVLADREHYRMRLLTLFLQVTQTLRARSDYRMAIQVAQQILTIDPANEHAYQHLMFCHMAAGDRPAALHQYELCQRALLAELDVPPLAETTALYQWIKQNRHEGAAAAAKITNLPIPLTNFIGRLRETATLKSLLRYGATPPRLMTLTGAGGSGKTRLAIQVATDLIDHYAHGVWWIELAALTDGAQLEKAVAKALGICETSHDSCRQRLIDFLAEKQLLLVIDNCEHLLEATALFMAELLRGAPELQILATSRIGLGLPGETIWQVPTLPLPEPEDHAVPEQLLHYECIRLFVERASAVQRNFTLTAANAAAVIEICRALDGIPLAIELAAARVKVLQVEQIALYLKGAIGARFALLTQGSRTGLPRQQTLRATIDWSYALLDEAERLLFRQIAIFHGGFTLEAVAQVATGNPAQDLSQPNAAAPHPQLLDLLTQLVDQSLVIVEPQGEQNRYRLLETLREYALGQYESDAEKQATQARHAAYFLQLAEAAGRELNGPNQPSWIHCTEVEQPNLRAALDFLIQQNAGEEALRLVSAIYHFWDVRGYLDEGRKWLQRALAKRASATVVTQARALNAAGWLAYGQSDLAGARPFYTESLALFVAEGRSSQVAGVLQNLAVLDMEEGAYDAAHQRLVQSVQRCRSVADEYGIARGLRYLGALAWEQGRITEAHAYFQESLAIHLAHGAHVSSAAGYLKVGDTERLLGNLESAHTNYTHCLEIGQRLGHRWLVGNALNGLGHVALARHAYPQAVAYGEEALTLFREVGDKTLIGFALATLGAATTAMGKHHKAYDYFCQSLAALQTSGYQLPIYQILGEMVSVLVTLGQQWETAARLLGAADRIRQRIGIAANPEQKLTPVAQTHAELAQRIRQALEPAHFVACWEAGQHAPIEQLSSEAAALSLARGL